MTDLDPLNEVEEEDEEDGDTAKQPRSVRDFFQKHPEYVNLTKQKMRERYRRQQDEVVLQEASVSEKNSFLCRVFMGIFLELSITITAIYLLTAEAVLGSLSLVPTWLYVAVGACLVLLGMILLLCREPEIFSTTQLIFLNVWSVALMTVFTSLLVLWIKNMYLIYAQIGTLCVVLGFILFTLQHRIGFSLNLAFLFCFTFDGVMATIFIYQPHMDFWMHPSTQWLVPPTDIIKVMTILVLVLVYQIYLLLNLKQQMVSIEARKRPLYVIFRLYLDVVKVMYDTLKILYCCSQTRAPLS